MERAVDSQNAGLMVCVGVNMIDKNNYHYQRHVHRMGSIVGSPLNCCWFEGGWPGSAAARALWLTEDTRLLSAFIVVMLCM